jgi:hypothetical protein
MAQLDVRRQSNVPGSGRFVASSEMDIAATVRSSLALAASDHYINVPATLPTPPFIVRERGQGRRLEETRRGPGPRRPFAGR